MSAAMVMGPTPPGTGVMKLHLGDTSAKATSPFRAKPLFLEASGTRVIPTSITTAPSFTISAFTNSGLPRAATIISLSLTNFLEIMCMRMTEGNRTISGIGICTQQNAHGTADNITPPDHSRRLPGCFNFIMFQQKHDTMRSCRNKTGCPSTSFPTFTG